MKTTRPRVLPQTAPEEGFTIIELVIVVVISSIVAGLIGSFVKRPLEGYMDLERRATLVNVAESAIQRMARDIRATLPNSLRVSVDSRSLEILHLADGARYRANPGTNDPNNDHTAATDWLDVTGDSQFNILGRFSNLDFSYGTALDAGHRITIYNTSSNVYSDAATDADPGVITPSATTITISNDGDEDGIALSSSFDFLLSSPRQRLYLVDTPVSYLCNLGSEEIRRYASYSIASTQPTDPSVAPLNAAGSSSLVTNRVGACEFTYDPGTPSRAGLITIDLTLTEDGEQVRLFEQVHVDNTP